MCRMGRNVWLAPATERSFYVTAHTLQRQGAPLLVLGILACIVLASCGGGGQSSTTTPPATPSAVLSATSLAFTSQVVNTSSAAMTVTLTNSGTAALTLSSIAASGNFTETNNCGSSVAAAASCTISVTFTPASVAALTGTLTITDNASGSPHTVALSGTGVAAASLSASPSSVAFGSVNVNQTSSQTVTLTNNGGSSLTISAVNLSGSGITLSGLNAPVTIAAGGSTTFTVMFSPTAAGSVSGAVSLTNSGTASPLSIPVTGTGVASAAVSLSPSSLSFGSVSLNVTSAAQTVTLSNNGTAALTISSIAVSGNYAQTNNCGSSLSSGSSCAINVTFTPLSTGSLSGTLTVTDSATGSPQTVALSGTGSGNIEVDLTWSASTTTVAGYNVYRSTISGGPYTKLTLNPVTVSYYADVTVQSGTTYYYVVTAISTAGLESGFSNEAIAAVP